MSEQAKLSKALVSADPRISSGSPSLLEICEMLGAFHEIQLEKFRDNMHKSGWRQCELEELVTALDKEVLELKLAIADKNWNEAGRECADVSNRSAMIADRLAQLVWKP